MYFSSMDLITTKPGFELCMVEECRDYGFSDLNHVNGLVTASSHDNPQSVKDVCFGSWYLSCCAVIQFTSNAEKVRLAIEWYCAAIRTEKIDNKWPLVWLSFTENGYLPDLSRGNALIEQLKKKVSRISKLAYTEYPVSGEMVDGLFVVETQGQIYCSRRAICYGQKRMKFDPDAPSRSYLKMEEAFSIINCVPSDRETVVDLGAAPGGWSYSASKHGAHVFAIDNGPLKKGALGNRLITHVCHDAFTWLPPEPVDWLLCDMVEQPSKVISLIKLWINKKLCRHLIVNLKCGYTAPVDILRIVRGTEGIAPLVKTCICRQLFHDRDEFTIMASTKF